MRFDLGVLVADNDQRDTVSGLMSRPRELGIRDVSTRFLVHPRHDPGCRQNAHELLRAEIHQFRFVIVIFDREGSGDENSSREELEKKVESRLFKNGWQGRAAAVVIDPELENWVWSESPELPGVCRWNDKSHSLTDWLKRNKFRFTGDGKPLRPKEAFEHVLFNTRVPRSSSLYGDLARKVDFERCTDPAFLKFKSKLQEWFPDHGHSSDP